MIKLLLAALFFALPANADMIGHTDGRRHVEWNSEEFRAMVKLGGGATGVCSGAFVSPNIILTAGHCVENTPFCQGGTCRVTNSRGQTFNARILKVGGANDRRPPRGTLNRDDWAFLAAPSREFYSEIYWPISPGAQPLWEGGMTSVGFGALRLISDPEIPMIRELYIEFLRGEITRLGRDRVEELGSATRLVASTAGNFDQFLAARRAQTGVAPLFTDAGRLKAHEDCLISFPARGTDGLFLVNHTCDNSSGDSGGPILNSQGRIAALISRGVDGINSCPAFMSSDDCVARPMVPGEAESQATRIDLFNLESRQVIR